MIDTHWICKLDLGTKEGLEEFEVMSALAHNAGYVWLGVGTISVRTKIGRESCVKILEGLMSRGLAVKHPSRPWLYGESGSVKGW